MQQVPRQGDRPRAPGQASALRAKELASSALPSPRQGGPRPTPPEQARGLISFTTQPPWRQESARTTSWGDPTAYKGQQPAASPRPSQQDLNSAAWGVQGPEGRHATQKKGGWSIGLRRSHERMTTLAGTPRTPTRRSSCRSRETRGTAASRHPKSGSSLRPRPHASKPPAKPRAMGQALHLLNTASGEPHHRGARHRGGHGRIALTRDRDRP